MLFMTSGYTVGILWTKRNYFLFDPHCRDNNGAVSTNNTGACDTVEIFIYTAAGKLYLREIYFAFAQTDKLQYEVQFVHIDKKEETVIYTRI